MILLQIPNYILIIFAQHTIFCFDYGNNDTLYHTKHRILLCYCSEGFSNHKKNNNKKLFQILAVFFFCIMQITFNIPEGVK